MSDSEPSQKCESLATSRSKRTLKDRHGRKAAFDRLRQLKGSKHKYEVRDVDSVYEEVEEREYVKRRQQRVEEDWIVDDDGSGYVEDGREVFEDEDDADDLFTAKKKRGTKGSSKKPSASNAQKDPAEGSLRRMFANMPTKKRKVESQEMTDMEKALLDECLNEETLKPSPVRLPEKKTYERKVLPKLTRVEKKPLKTYATPEGKSLKSYSANEDKKPLTAGIPQEERKPLKTLNTDTLKQETPAAVFDDGDLTNEDLCNAFSDIEDVDATRGQAKEEEKDSVDDSKYMEETTLKDEDIIRAEISKAEIKPVKDIWETTSSVSETSVSLQDVQIDTSMLPLVTNAEGEKIFRFYWLDAYEDFHHVGTVYLFGKVYIESAKSHVSCCLTVKNIERRIYLLPRIKRKNLRTNTEDDEEITMTSVYQEFNSSIANKFKIKEFKTRKSTKQYCFEKFEVPFEADYLEVRYSTDYPPLPQSLEGETFSHVFGTNTSSLELLLMDAKIKGPCWIDVKAPQPSSPKISWCKIEALATRPESIAPVVGLQAPPLSVASLTFRTAVNPKTHQNEIILASCLFHKEFYIDKPPPSPLFQTHWCALSKPSDTIWPWDFLPKLGNYKATAVEKCETERSLLGFFLAKLFKMDPDVIIGHDIFGFDLSVLLHRIQVQKIPHWSRIGRLKRTQMPKTTARGIVEKIAISGRLLCDTKISSKELVRAKSYELGALVSQILRVNENERIDYSFEQVKQCYGSSDKILQLVNATMQDSFYCLKLVVELNVLPLALQITNIAGNVLSRTLLGGRSERNEFLLLHAFTEKNFICPDKQYGKSKALPPTALNEDDEEGPGKSKNGKKKASYAGGLVLEPKKGFYDKYILLMDFNSLYPSIIQEYNVCFTTVNREKLSDEEALPDVPDSGLKPGILPTEIRKLVESRREVKKLMKQPNISAELKQQYDIRQKALKLTANSMYGCLGFSNSRFFAKHLAALITGKGREILLNTKNLVQKLNFDVIYGDTDSIMINTNSSDYDQVFKLGHKIKVEVNKLYKHLELDVDGVFKFMLLLKKKKYAAVTISKLPSGQLVEEKELKGLDIVRRDWSQLAAGAGNYILDQILSEQGPDERIENIHSHLEALKTRLEKGEVSLDELVITKQLTKDPSDYPDKNSLPHVQVAMRVNSKGGKRLRQGDTVPYIICLDGSNLSAVQRAYHLDEVKTNKDIKIDTTYYLAHQVHPVVARLCDPIEGTDAARIAECLGLDPSGYRSQSNFAEREEETLATDISDEEKYKLCQRFSFKCPSSECQMVVTMDAPTRGAGSSTEFLLESCPNPKCKSSPYKHHEFILNKLRREIRQHIAAYYDGWLLCEDPACNHRTRRIPLRFNRGFPLCNQCHKGVLFREFSEAQLYKQLCFYEYIFDFQKGCNKNKELRNKESLKRVYSILQSEVQHHLQVNAFSIINLGSIFSYLYTKTKLDRCYYGNK